MAVVFAAAVAVAATAKAQTVLLSDSFNRTVGDPLNTPPQLSSWGDNDNSLGGSIVQTYVTSNPFTDAGNTGGAWVDGFQGTLAYAFAKIDYNWAANSQVAAGGGLRIEFNLEEGGVASGHYAWWLGTAGGDVGPDFFQAGGSVPLLNANADVGLLWRNAGGSGGSFLAGVAVNNFFSISPPLTAVDPNAIRIDVATANFNSGTPATVSLYIDGAHVDINGAAAGNDLSFAWDGQGEAYMGFSKNIAVGGGGFDNLRISTLQAAPTTNADFNGDLVVNGHDFHIWQRGLGLSGQTTNANGDANGDTVVDAADLTAWRAQFGGPPALAATATVPEPQAALLLALAAVGGGSPRRRNPNHAQLSQ